MRTATILRAIEAMRNADRLGLDTEPRLFAHLLVSLAQARIELEIELAAEHPTVEVTP